MEKVTVFTDGGARGNPGPAAIGVYILDAKGGVVREHGECIGDATNNIAEYQAIVRALEILRTIVSDTKGVDVTLKLDSQLVQRQMLGEYKVKDATLKTYFDTAKTLVTEYNRVDFIHVTRNENKEADRLVNEALDAI